MKNLDYTEVTIKLMDEYTSKYLQENAELVQDTIKATLEAINYSQCCKSDSEQLCECKKHSIKTNYGFEICTKCGNEFDD